MSIMDFLTSLYAPDECLGCGHEGALLCGDCQCLLPRLKGICFGCKRSVDGAACGPCLKSLGLDSLQVMADYGGFAKHLVSALKFRGNRSAARIMADAMKLPVVLPDAVVAHVPATNEHIRQRGYDQAALLARHLAGLHGLPAASLLRRAGTGHQLGADRLERQRQLKHAVWARAASPTVYLCDDVITTGASLQASATALRRAGAKRIVGLIFAQSVQ